VFYDARRPEDARIDLFLENWLQPILVGIVGGMVVGAMAFIVAQLRQW
jgi:hypothetical protein